MIWLMKQKTELWFTALCLRDSSILSYLFLEPPSSSPFWIELSMNSFSRAIISRHYFESDSHKQWGKQLWKMQHWMEFISDKCNKHILPHYLSPFNKKSFPVF